MVLDVRYSCDVKKFPNITGPETFITSVTGTHLDGMNNLLVEAIDWDETPSFHIARFPRGIENIFPNLKLIRIYNTKLEKIGKTDFKPFKELQMLAIHGNYFEIIERDLFEYVPKLKYIRISACNISYIDPHVFDHLKDLEQLYFESNICVNENAFGKSNVAKLITKLKDKCSDSLKLSSYISNLSVKISHLSEKVSMMEQNEKTLMEKIERFKFDSDNRSEIYFQKFRATPENESKADDEILINKNISLFIVIPIVCLATVLNVILVIACVRKKINLTYVENNVESECENEIIV
jgi:hypothetical protein